MTKFLTDEQIEARIAHLPELQDLLESMSSPATKDAIRAAGEALTIALADQIHWRN